MPEKKLFLVEVFPNCRGHRRLRRYMWQILRRGMNWAKGTRGTNGTKGA